MDITLLSKNALNDAIRRLEKSESCDPRFEDLYGKAGRKFQNKSSLHTKIREIMGNDNSLTQRGCKELLPTPVSLPQLSREFKAAGLSRKRLKKKSSVTQSEANIIARQAFCASILGMGSRKLIFLDESGFNLHTSINYGYSSVNHDATVYQPKAKGRNISLCAAISINGILHSTLIDGAYNKNIFLSFLEECARKDIFNGNVVLIMDNVRFHHCEIISTFLKQYNVQEVFLPTYSPDLNPIENVFSCIKARLHAIRPRAASRNELKEKILNIISSFGTCDNYYEHFWKFVNLISNRQIF